MNDIVIENREWRDTVSAIFLTIFPKDVVHVLFLYAVQTKSELLLSCPSICILSKFAKSQPTYLIWNSIPRQCQVLNLDLRFDKEWDGWVGRYVLKRTINGQYVTPLQVVESLQRRWPIMSAFLLQKQQRLLDDCLYLALGEYQCKRNCQHLLVDFELPKKENKPLELKETIQFIKTLHSVHLQLLECGQCQKAAKFNEELFGPSGSFQQERI